MSLDSQSRKYHLRYHAIVDCCDHATSESISDQSSIPNGNFPDRVTYSFVIFETVLVLIRLLTSNDGASEGLGLFIGKQSCGVGDTCQQLLFPYPSSDFTVRTILRSTKLEVRIRSIDPSSRAEETFRRFVNAKVYHVIVTSKSELRLTL